MVFAFFGRGERVSAAARLGERSRSAGLFVPGGDGRYVTLVLSLLECCPHYSLRDERTFGVMGSFDDDRGQAMWCGLLWRSRRFDLFVFSA